MILDASQECSGAFHVKGPGQKELVIHLLREHRKLPIRRAHMGDSPCCCLWIANACGVQCANLHQEMERSLSLSPSVHMNRLKM